MRNIGINSNTLKRFLSLNRWFLGGYATLLLLGAVMVFFISKGEMVLFLHDSRTEFLNWVFVGFTWAAEEWSLLVIIPMLLWHKTPRLALAFVYAALLTFLLVQGGKHFVFPDWHRPAKSIIDQELSAVYNEELRRYFSFPSGHSAAAFQMFSFLAFMSKRKELKMFWLFVAIGCATSRVYLGQHFFQDVVAGSVIGVVSSLISYYFFYLKFKGNKHPFLDRKLKNRKSV